MIERRCPFCGADYLRGMHEPELSNSKCVCSTSDGRYDLARLENCAESRGFLSGRALEYMEMQHDQIVGKLVSD